MKASSNICSTELRYVSALVRARLDTVEVDSAEMFNLSLENDFKMKFWSTCHTVFNSALKYMPTFDIDKCYSYFMDTVSCTDRSRSFIPPNHLFLLMPSLPPPMQKHVTRPPSYRTVARAVNRCRSGSSACPLDQLSRIPECWKREPLYSYIKRVILMIQLTLVLSHCSP